MQSQTIAVARSDLPNPQNSQASAISSKGAPLYPGSIFDSSRGTNGRLFDMSPLSSQDHDYGISASQSQPTQTLSSVRDDYKVPQLPSTPKVSSQSHESGEAARPPSNGSASSSSVTYGSKRTSSGMLKPSRASTQDTPLANGVVGRSRAMSTDGAQTKISELSAQLKTRLSYAMLKVNNGWENRSIDEVEALASKLSSPTSSQHLCSPRTSLHSPHSALSNPNSRPLELGHGPAGDLARLSDRTPISRQAQWSAQTVPPKPAVLTNGPSLAPAPELVPSLHSHSRRVSGTFQQPPRLFTSSSGGSTGGNYYQLARTPYTRTTTPTPQEQDAVDTLLFMSSPANSGRFPFSARTAASSAQTSPARTEFGPRQPPRLMKGVSASSSEEDAWSGGRHARPADDDHRQAKRRSMHLRNEQDVERLLDQMRDASREASNEGELTNMTGSLPHSASASARTTMARG